MRKEGTKMKLTLEIGKIDYAAVAEKALPLLKDKLAAMDGPMAKMLSGIASLPPAVIRGTINALPESTRNQIVSFLINHNAEKIISAAQSFAEKQGVPLAIDGITVEE